MKKIIFFFVCFLGFLPIINAQYNITNYRVDLTILENGDVVVTEAFKMDGVYNGIERNIYYRDNYDDYYGNSIIAADRELYDGNDVELLEVRAINFATTDTFEELQENGDLFKAVNEATKGQHGVYTITSLTNGEKYKIYNPSKMNKDFYLSYTLENMIINHEDVSELAMYLFKDMEEVIENLEITIHIAGNQNLLKTWVHGNFDKTINIIDEETVQINIPYLEDSQALDFRVVFDAGITDSNKRSHQTVLEQIEKIEEKLISTDDEVDDEYNSLKESAYNLVSVVEKTYDRSDYDLAYQAVLLLRDDDELKTQLLIKLMNIDPKIERREVILKVALTSIMAFWLVGIMIIIYQIYKKYGNKEVFEDKYFVDLPDYEPFISGYILRKKITNNDLIASILDMIDKKIIILKKVNNEYIFSQKKTKDLTDEQEKMLKFLFDNQNEITFNDFKDRAKNNHNRFLNLYSNWFNKANDIASAKEYYANVTIIKMIGIIYSIIGIFLGVFLLDRNTYFSSIVIFLLGIVSLGCFVVFFERTTKGNEEYSKLLALKRFMCDLSKVDSKMLPDFKNWRSYFAYSLSLGCKKRLIKAFNKIDHLKCAELIDEYKVVENVISESLNLAYFKHQ